MGIPETMMAQKRIVHGFLTLLVLMIFGVAGCGYKTMPIPPEEIVPKAITDLRYELDEKGVTLNWTYPEETVKGETLSDITSFKLYRAVVAADKYCENCPIPFGEPILVEGGAVAAGQARTAVYSATLLRPGHLFFFKVRSGAGWWAESADSNVVSFMWDLPPASSQNLDATVADRKVMLHWSPVTAHMDGTTITETVKYQVFRSSGGGVFSSVGGLQSGLEYVDDQVVNGRKYQYKVQTVTMYEKGQVGGGLSPVFAVIPVGETVLPVPTGVQGVRTANGVKIIWDRVEADLKGYRVYRRLPNESKPVIVGEVNVPATIFNDTSMPESDDWFYSVSSIDRVQPANESKLSAEVKVRN